MAKAGRLWWQDGVIYQVYPRSFQDSNGDGIGDLNGILSRLDYVKKLGVDAVWISPFYPSPMADFGYDVADYCGVDPIFGTLADFDRLVEGTHARELKLILDFVPNHSSDVHPWFLESRSSRAAEKRDWYIWRDPAPGGGPPNNWVSSFGGSAWTLDEETGQYYYHSFLKEQPDLNWRNPRVRLAMYDAMRFWLDRGVDGFRMDVLWMLIKDGEFRNNPRNPDWKPEVPHSWSVLPLYTADRPETREIVAEMRSVMRVYPERALIGEIYLPLRDLIAYYGFDPNTADLRGADIPFNFHLIQTEWNADRIAQLIGEYEGELPAGAWPNWVLGNHDQTRLATRIGVAQARVAAMLLLTLRGTPTLYNGDELGMTDGVIAPEEVRDPSGRIGPGRDPERTPMPWDGSANCGFTSGTPWLPMAAGSEEISVAMEERQERSMLSLYRRLLELRRKHPALHAGIVEDVTAQSGVLSYRRTLGEERFEVLLNMTGEPQQVQSGKGQVVLTTIMDGEGAELGGDIVVEGAEGVLIRLAS